MFALRDNLAECWSAVRAHKLRASLTMLGLTMGVATLITVMTIVQGANVYVEQKIANLGTNVFQVARTPFAVTDFNVVIKALKYRKIEQDDLAAMVGGCASCEQVGATAGATVRARYGNREVTDVSLGGSTASMADIDTRAVERGRYFTAAEADHRVNVCLIGDTLVQQLFLGVDPLGKTLRLDNEEFLVIGVMEKLGSVLAQDQATLILRARRHLSPRMENDFFIGTKESYMALWRSISSAFFAVFILVSAISVLIGGIVIMNVMLMGVTARKREIGVRRAVGATKLD